MKYAQMKTFAVAGLLSLSLWLSACKSKPKETTAPAADTTTTNVPAPAAPVVINPDDSLKTGVKDATKDYPGVKTDVSNGEITLTGTVERSKLPGLIQTLNSLRPKKINNQLTIK